MTDDYDGLDPAFAEACRKADVKKETVVKRISDYRTKNKNRAEFVRVSDVKFVNPDWLWPGFLARKKISIFTGDSALGKSQITADLAAAITRRHEWADGTKAPDGSVIFLNAEDGIEDTIGPRLEAAGADCSRVHVLTAVYADNKPAIFNVATNMELIAEKVKSLGDVALLVIDPITAYLGGDIDSYRMTDVRVAMQPLKESVEALNIASLMIAHPAKAAVVNALHYVAGSGAFTHGPRLAFMAIEDPETPSSRLFIPYKNSMGILPSGMRYEIVGCQVGPDRSISTSYVSWGGPVTMTANEALAATVEKSKAKARGEATDFLRSNMSDPGEPYSAKELAEKAKAEGISYRTLHRAADKLGIQKQRKGFKGPIDWTLPKGDSE